SRRARPARRWRAPRRRVSAPRARTPRCGAPPADLAGRSWGHSIAPGRGRSSRAGFRDAGGSGRLQSGKPAQRAEIMSTLPRPLALLMLWLAVAAAVAAADGSGEARSNRSSSAVQRSAPPTLPAPEAPTVVRVDPERGLGSPNAPLALV